MKIFKLALLCSMFVVGYSCKNDTKDEQKEATETVEDTSKSTEDTTKKLTIDLESRSESSATGSVYFTEQNGEVTMEAEIVGLSPGSHAIHLHEKSDCSSADGKSTGGHWNPTFASHGEWGAEAGYHKGDIGNFEASEEGVGRVSFTTDEWCIGCGDETKDIVGKAVVVHQGVDDFVSQPSGAAGARISCGGVIQ